MSTELKPCPFCGLGGEKAGAHTDDCYFSLSAALRVAPKGDLSLVPDILTAWNRRASPAAAVPEGAMPPLPDPWEDRFNKHPHDSYQAQIACLKAEITEWRARAAVEADRAQQQQAMSNAEAAAWAALGGLIYLAMTGEPVGAVVEVKRKGE